MGTEVILRFVRVGVKVRRVNLEFCGVKTVTDIRQHEEHFKPM